MCLSCCLTFLWFTNSVGKELFRAARRWSVQSTANSDCSRYIHNASSKDSSREQTLQTNGDSISEKPESRAWRVHVSACYISQQTKTQTDDSIHRTEGNACNTGRQTWLKSYLCVIFLIFDFLFCFCAEVQFCIFSFKYYFHLWKVISRFMVFYIFLFLLHCQSPPICVCLHTFLFQIVLIQKTTGIFLM